MPGFLIRMIISALGLWLATMTIPSIEFATTGTLVAAAFWLGIVNAIVRSLVGEVLSFEAAKAIQRLAKASWKAAGLDRALCGRTRASQPLRISNWYRTLISTNIFTRPVDKAAGLGADRV